MLRGDFLDDPESKFGRLKFMKSFRYEIQLGSELGQLFGTEMFHSSSREIYHRLSQQTRKFQ